MRKHLTKFFELTPNTLKEIVKEAEIDTGVKNLMFESDTHTTMPLGRLIKWLTTTWPKVTQTDHNPLDALAPPLTNETIDAVTQQQMKILQETQTRANGTIPTVPQEGETAHQQTAGTGTAPFKDEHQDDLPERRKPEQQKTSHQQAHLHLQGQR